MLEETGILALLGLPRIGPKTVLRLIKAGVRIFDRESFETSVRSTLPSVTRFVPPPPEEISRIWVSAKETISDAQDKGVQCVAFSNSLYPARLRNIPDPPPILFVLGDRGCLDAPCVAVVGTRSPSAYGASCAERIAKRIALKGITVVSGLAEGCDTEAHKGALHGRGRTVAVLAHGFGRVYPASNRDLADEILANGGCWVSEYAPGVPASRSSFVQRDRLQSGLSKAVIVIETDEQGGTMHTVGFAIDQKRGVFAVDHPPSKRGHPKTRGNQALIREGKASPLSTAKDLGILIHSILTDMGKIPIEHQGHEDELPLGIRS